MTDAVSTGTSEVADAAAAQATTDSATPVGESNSGDSYDVSTNPAWQPVLDKLPGPYQELIKPHFAEWDKNFQKVQESYNPWKQFADAGVNPQTVMEALQLRQLANSEQGVRQIYDQIVAQYGQQWNLTPAQAEQAVNAELQKQQTPQGNNSQGQTELDLGLEEIDPRYVPVEKYEELKKNLGIVGEYLATQEAQKQQQQIDSEIDAEVEQLKQKYGAALTDDKLMMVYKLAAGAQDNSLIPAAEALFGAIGQQAPQPGLPRVMAPGGGTPSNAVDVTSLSRDDTRKTALAMLNALRSQGD